MKLTLKVFGKVGIQVVRPENTVRQEHSRGQ